jgi:hypothetical protein
MNEKTANKIYDILVKECGAFEDERKNFVYRQTTEEIKEWRFCGKLGFGGKFWCSNSRYVTCYNEDETPKRRKMIEQANKLLAEL